MLNQDNTQSPLDIQIHYKDKYSVVRLTPVLQDDWYRIAGAVSAVKKALERYKLPNALASNYRE